MDIGSFYFVPSVLSVAMDSGRAEFNLHLSATSPNPLPYNWSKSKPAMVM
jgi:hypothetical protein